MQPNGKITGPNFGVNDLAFGRAVNTARGKAKRLDKEWSGGVLEFSALQHSITPSLQVAHFPPGKDV
jgi:hypothetical protein